MRVVVGFVGTRADDPGSGGDRDLVERHCRRRGWKLLHIYDHAAGQAAGQAIEFALREIANGGARGLVVARLACVGDSAPAIRELDARLKRSNAILAAVEEEIDTSRRDGPARLSAFLDGADWRSRSVGRRISEGQPARSRLAGHPEIVERIHSLRYDRYMALDEIAKLLDREGVPTVRRAERWWSSTIHAALRLPRPSEEQLPGRTNVGSDTNDSPGDAPEAQSRTREGGSPAAERHSRRSAAGPSGKFLESDRRRSRKRRGMSDGASTIPRREAASSRPPSTRRREDPESHAVAMVIQECRERAVREEIDAVAGALLDVLGEALTTLAVGLQNVQQVKQYERLTRGRREDDPVEGRLRELFLVTCLLPLPSPSALRDWMRTENPQLAGQTPAKLMRAGQTEPVLREAECLRRNSRGLTPDLTKAKAARHGVLLLEFADGLAGKAEVLDRMRGPAFDEARTRAGFPKASVDAGSGDVVWPGGGELSARTLYVHLRTGLWLDDDVPA